MLNPFKKIKSKYVVQFQFDDDEPTEVAELGKPDFQLNLSEADAEIVFNSPNGKTFKIFVTEV